MTEVELKNGSRELELLVKIMLILLKELIEERPVFFYEFVMLCRDRNHKLFGGLDGEIGKFLQKRQLVNDLGEVHSSVENVVLSAVEGEGLDMTLVNPLKEG